MLSAPFESFDCTGCLGDLEEGSQAQCISRTEGLAAVVAGIASAEAPDMERDLHLVALWVRDQQMWM